MEGEAKINLPKWPGFNGINTLLGSIKVDDTLKSLETEYKNIEEEQERFETLLQTNSRVITDPRQNIQSMEPQEGSSNKDYRLDITSKSIYGVFNMSPNKVEPEYSYIELWYKEYFEIALDSKTITNNIQKDFEIVLKVRDFLKSSIEKYIGNNINDIKETIFKVVTDYSYDITDYGKLGFNIVFSVLLMIDVVIAAFMILFFFLSGKLSHKDCCCCKCRSAFNLVIFLLWNIYIINVFKFINWLYFNNCWFG